MRPVPLLVLPLLLSGCSGTPFGETLSRSFSSAPVPGAAVPRSPASAPTIPRPSSPPPKPDSPLALKPGPTAPPLAAPPLSPPVTPAPTATPPPNPAPYRVTILLPQADPAAPAEVLTRALRSAGVPFEVETIQRTAPGELARPASALPATPMAPAAPPTPTVRPAPLPR